MKQICKRIWEVLVAIITIPVWIIWCAGFGLLTSLSNLWDAIIGNNDDGTRIKINIKK